jgi:hypothetical protein
MTAFWPLEILAFVGLIAGPAHADEWAALAPGIATGSWVDIPTAFGLGPTSIYFVRPGSETGRRIVLGPARELERLSMSAERGLIAARVVLKRKTGEAPPLEGGGVMIVDTLGTEVATIPGARLCEWSPDGQKLALWFSSDEEELPYSDSISVWDSGTRTLRTCQTVCTAVGWLTPSSLLLNRPEGGQVLSLTSGLTARSARHGTMTSPDTTFSLYINYERGPEVWNELRGVDLTERVIALLDGGRLQFTSWPFWVRGSVNGHLLCFNSCRYSNSPGLGTPSTPTCEAVVVDVAEMAIVKRIPGSVIGPTADKSGLAVLYGQKVRFIDLAP